MKCFVLHYEAMSLEICALLGYYAALSGSSIPTFRDNLSVPYLRVKKSNKKAGTFLGVLTLKDGNDMLSRNVGTEQLLNIV